MNDQIKRKARKLLRDPDKFFYDMLDKRMRRSEGVADAALALPRDFITDNNDLFDEIVELLITSTFQIQEMSAEHRHERRIAIKESDSEYAIDLIREHDMRLRPVVTFPEDQGGLVEITFTDGVIRYTNPTIQLDPWRLRGDLVQSTNVNRFTSSISVLHLHDTPCSPAPLYMMGDTSHDISLERRLGLRQSVLHHFPYPFDVVYTWVDGHDPQWLERKELFLRDSGRPYHPESVSVARFRSRDELRYSMRSLASFLKDVRRIHIVTDSQVPSWLDVDHPLINVVDHSQIFPDPSWLPSFNSHAIEANLHRIEGLAEHFLYFNDDVLLLNPCSPLDFFHSNGIGKAFFERLGHLHGKQSPEFPAFKNAALRGARLLEERYGRSPHAYHEHVVHAIRRSGMERMWDEFREPLELTCQARIRGDGDVSPVSFFYHYFAILNGLAVPDRIESAYVPLGKPGSGHALKRLRSDRETKVVCINDLPSSDARSDSSLKGFLRHAYPTAAEWEKDQ